MDRQGASVAIQISGMFGSQQEKAQRLGRILRPKPGANQAHFYTIVSHDTREQDFALKRQLFLCEQGYEYHIEFEGEFEGESDGESKEAAHSSQSGYCLGGRPADSVTSGRDILLSDGSIRSSRSSNSQLSP